jgi:hypothetical protein
MKQKVLIRRVRNLLNRADERCNAGTPNRANVVLRQIRELLDKELDGKPSAPRVCGSEGSRT